MDEASARLTRVRANMDAACAAADRPAGSVRLLAVSKGHPPEALRRLRAAGQRAFGENRLQEALAKQAALAGTDIEWHFIGPVQSNKTREIAEHFDWVQSADRLRVLERLSAQRPRALPRLRLLLQVNIDAEPQKAGADPADLPQLAAAAMALPGLELRGLMCIPRQDDDEARTRDSFLRLRAMYDGLVAAGVPLDTLSMGMSADYPLAIAAGSTLVRIGTALFGARPADRDD